MIFGVRMGPTQSASILDEVPGMIGPHAHLRVAGLSANRVVVYVDGEQASMCR